MLSITVITNITLAIVILDIAMKVMTVIIATLVLKLLSLPTPHDCKLAQKRPRPEIAT